MAPRTLVCGSLALDTIMVFPDRFARHILPEQTHMLSVSFLVGENQSVAWEAHVGGFLAGLLLFSLFDPVHPAPAVEDERTLH